MSSQKRKKMSSALESANRLDRLRRLLAGPASDAQAFARLIGVKARTYQGYEEGKYPPKFPFLMALKAHYPEANLDWLVSGEGEPVHPDEVVDGTRGASGPVLVDFSAEDLLFELARRLHARAEPATEPGRLSPDERLAQLELQIERLWGDRMPGGTEEPADAIAEVGPAAPGERPA